MLIGEIYILTTREYNKDYLYKIGKSSNTSKRLKTLNTSRLKDDEMYICYIAKCHDANTVESFIHNCLTRHCYENNREFFAMKFERLVAVVDIACTSRESDYEKILKLLEEDRWDNYADINPTSVLPIEAPVCKEEISNQSDNSIMKYFNKK